MRKALLAAVAAVSAITFSIGGATVASAQEDKTIVEIASANKDLSTLVTAVTAAELVETLSGEGPFTVFAPTDEAFKALPAGVLDDLLKDPKGKLADVLKLHVIAGAVDSKAATAAAGTEVETLGGKVKVELDGDKLKVGGATVVTADIKAKNGIIHVIDAVITGPAEAAAEGTEAATAEATEAATAATEAAAETPASEATPARVDTGDDGLAAKSSNNNGLLTIAGVGALGVAGSTLVLARRRRRN
jgi:LPXTG-motif cell wall-anchored protein